MDHDGAVGRPPPETSRNQRAPRSTTGVRNRFWRNSHGKHPYRSRPRRRRVPVLAVTLCSGVAAADNGVLADSGSGAGVATAGGGVGCDNSGNSATARQQAVGSGALNRSGTAQMRGSAFAAVDQGDSSVLADFGNLW